MTEESTTENDDLPVEPELDSLKARAKQMGIKFHPSSGIDSLKDKINARMGELDTDPLDAEPDPEPEVKAGPETAMQRKVRQKKECTRLIRIRVACMNPNKSDYDGEIFTTGNTVVGTIKKQAYGFHDRDYLRLKILRVCGKLDES